MKKFLMLFMALSLFLSVSAMGEIDEILFKGVTHWPIGIETYDICAADLNNDGYLDIASADYSSYEVTYIFGYGDGTFSGVSKVDIGSSVYGLCIGDVDNDNYIDIIAKTGYDYTFL